MKNSSHQTEPYQPHSIPPIGGPTLPQAAQNPVPSPRIIPQRNLRYPNLKYEVLEISEVRGTFERKMLVHYRYFGPL